MGSAMLEGFVGCSKLYIQVELHYSSQPPTQSSKHEVQAWAINLLAFLPPFPISFFAFYARPLFLFTCLWINAP